MKVKSRYTYLPRLRSSKSSMQSLKYGLAVATIPLSALWAGSATFAHVDSAQDNSLLKSLVSHQNLLASLIFGTVATSGFLSMYPLRSMNFALAALGTLAGYFAINAEADEDKKHNISQILEAIIIGFLGVAAVSKGNISYNSDHLSLEFPKANNLTDVRKGWKNNLKTEIDILKEQFSNSGSLTKDFLLGSSSGIKNVFFPSAEFRGLGKLDRFREAATKYGKNWSSGAFQITGIMRLLACGLTLSSIFMKDDKQNIHAEKADTLASTSSWLVSLSLIPAAIAALNKNSKWSSIPNLLFNASALLAIPGLVLKLIPKSWIDNFFGKDKAKAKSANDFIKIVGGLCTKLLIALQMLAYALSQCLRK